MLRGIIHDKKGGRAEAEEAMGQHVGPIHIHLIRHDHSRCKEKKGMRKERRERKIEKRKEEEEEEKDEEEEEENKKNSLQE